MRGTAAAWTETRWRRTWRGTLTRQPSWVSPLRKLVRKATKKGKDAAASKNLLLAPPSPSRTMQGREASNSKNGAGEGQGLSSESKKLLEAITETSALDRSGYAGMMKSALKRIHGGDASHHAGAFAEMEQAMKGLMHLLFKVKAPVLPGVFMSNSPHVDSKGWSQRDIIADPFILASGELTDKFSHKWSSLGADQTLMAPNHLLRDVITAWCLDHSIPPPSSTIGAFDEAPPSKEEIPLLLEKLSMHSTEQQEVLHRIQLLSASSKGVQPCLNQWQDLLPKLIILHKKWKATWSWELEEQRLTIILNLSLHRTNREILAKQVQLPDALKKTIERAKKLGYPLASMAKVSSVIAVLSEFHPFRSKVVEIGGISMLCRLLDTKDALVWSEASAAILALCTDDTTIAIAQQNHVIDALLEGLSDGLATDSCLFLLERTLNSEFLRDRVASSVALLMEVITQHGTGHVTSEGIQTAVCLVYNAVKNDARRLRSGANLEDFVDALKNLETREMSLERAFQIEAILELALEFLPD